MTAPRNSSEARMKIVFLESLAGFLAETRKSHQIVSVGRSCESYQARLTLECQILWRVRFRVLDYFDETAPLSVVDFQILNVFSTNGVEQLDGFARVLVWDCRRFLHLLPL